ncbi:hypothetical protein FNW54_10285 [Bacteroides sp. HF-5092]|uniref:hypothetical protein n=1 Tax=Bacteroides TaxID=816 RepID=UPI00117842DE|nr:MULTISPECIES: hypothetical protein [Bacteroides]TRX44975.1 hypothetical protein FNW54_10285 [Bacteroides sp. HF-5092]
MDNNYENIVPWNGANDTGRDVRLKLQRNFSKIGINFQELEGKFTTVDELFDLIAQELEKKLSKTENDRAAGIITFLKGLVAEELIQANNGLVVRKTELVEDSSISLIEEDEDSLVEELNISGEANTLGELTNVNIDVDTAAPGSLFVKEENWEAVPPVLSSLTDYDNMLMPVFHKVLGKWVFISVSSISGGVTPPVTLELVLDTGLLDVNKLA